MSTYREAILAVLSPEEFNDYPTMADQMRNDIIEFEKIIPIKSKPSVLSNKEMTEDNYFKNSTTLGALAMLAKFQNDVLNTESLMIIYFNSHVSSYTDSFESYSAIATQSSSYVKAGDSIEIFAGVGAFSVASNPSITINGHKMIIGEDGVASHRLKSSQKPGKYTVPVVIEFIKPDGSPLKMSKVLKYTVAK